jgi:hypothetical protein
MLILLNGTEEVGTVKLESFYIDQDNQDINEIFAPAELKQLISKMKIKYMPDLEGGQIL